MAPNKREEMKKLKKLFATNLKFFILIPNINEIRDHICEDNISCLLNMTTSDTTLLQVTSF